MASITDPRAITFANVYLRPICEEIRALKARITDANNQWTANSNAVAGLFGTNADVLVDGRAAEGINQLTGLQVQQAIGVFSSLASAVNDQIIQVPCVRPLAAT